MKTLENVKETVDLAAEWILNSGIQSGEGPFYAWYDPEKKDYSYLYSEITGYGITTLLFLRKILGKNNLIAKAKRAAEWIIGSSMHSCGGVRTRLYKDDAHADKDYSFSAGNIFSFDTGMVLYGMVNLYRTTSDLKFLEASVAMADFLTGTMLNADGGLAPIFNAEKEEKVDPQDNKWSNQSGPYHAKVSMALADIFDITKDDKYRKAAIKICEYALEAQEPSGRFVTDRISRTTNLHPHSYAAEGLLYTGLFFDIPEFVRSSRKASEWIFAHISGGGINELYDPRTDAFNDVRRSDVIAQALRIGLLNSIDYKMEDLANILLEHQDPGTDRRLRGAFIYTRQSRHVNAWCTMFALQALAFYRNTKLISKKNRTELFI